MDTKIIEKINQNIQGNEASYFILHKHGIIKHYNKGYRIYPDSKELLGLLYIMEGKVRFFSISPNSKEITIFFIKSDETCIISTSCILNTQIDIVLEFMEDSKIFLLPDKEFSKLSKQNENIMRFNLSLVSKRLRQALETINDVTFQSLKDRVIKFLISNAVNNNITCTQEYIANNIGSAREAVARILKELKEDKLIVTQKNKIILQEKIYLTI